MKDVGRHTIHSLIAQIKDLPGILCALKLKQGRIN